LEWNKEFENHFKDSSFYCTFVSKIALEFHIQSILNIPDTGDIVERPYETADVGGAQYEL